IQPRRRERAARRRVWRLALDRSEAHAVLYGSVADHLRVKDKDAHACDVKHSGLPCDANAIVQALSRAEGQRRSDEVHRIPDLRAQRRRPCSPARRPAAMDGVDRAILPRAGFKRTVANMIWALARVYDGLSISASLSEPVR